MSYIIIDGYNCIGVMYKDLQKARIDFIHFLADYRQKSGHNITVVFDGHKGESHKETISFQGGIRIIYTPIGISADDTILRVISQERYQWIVISDDRMISKSTWSMGMVAISCGLFMKKVQKSLGIDENNEADTHETKRLSKRQKAIKRALSNL